MRITFERTEPSRASWVFRGILWLFCAGALTACSTTEDPLAGYEEVKPATNLKAPVSPTTVTDAQVAHGKYLVEILGCSSCHTHGAITGTPDKTLRLAGSRVGIAYSNPLADIHPAVAYPPNLTPDDETGIGRWSIPDVVSALRHGLATDGKRLLNVMPWPAYVRLSDSDATDIAHYLKSLPPVSHQVPGNVPQGRRAPEPFVYFGVYRGRES